MLKQSGIICTFKKAKLTPTARASILVAIDKIINSVLSNSSSQVTVNSGFFLS